MITNFTIANVEGRIESAEALSRQRFPRLNVNLDSVSVDGTKIKVTYTFLADYFDGDAKDAKTVGQVKLSGFIELTESKDSATAVQKRWTEKKMLPVELAEEIINGLNFRCSATGTLVAYALGLIPPIVVSQTKIQDPQAQGGK